MMNKKAKGIWNNKPFLYLDSPFYVPALKFWFCHRVVA